MYLSWVGSLPLTFKQRAADKARNLIHHKFAKHASLKDASSLKSGLWLVMINLKQEFCRTTHTGQQGVNFYECHTRRIMISGSGHLMFKSLSGSNLLAWPG